MKVTKEERQIITIRFSNTDFTTIVGMKSVGRGGHCFDIQCTVNRAKQLVTKLQEVVNESN